MHRCVRQVAVYAQQGATTHDDRIEFLIASKVISIKRRQFPTAGQQWFQQRSGPFPAGIIPRVLVAKTTDV
jgi:hypothetical protein